MFEWKCGEMGKYVLLLNISVRENETIACSDWAEVYSHKGQIHSSIILCGHHAFLRMPLLITQK